MKIYLASSWRNAKQPEVLAKLRAWGHEVYDFRNPKPGDTGFSWRAIDPDWQQWTPEQYVEALKYPVSTAGFKNDMDALKWCAVCVLLLPCGRSAHTELGWAAGAGKRTYVLMLDQQEPELMYLMCDRVCTNLEDLRLLLWPSDSTVSAREAAFIREFERVQEETQKTSMAKGLYEGDPANGGPVPPNHEPAPAQDAFDAMKIALMHSELSEALEALRVGNPPDSKLPEFSSVAVELADIVLRVMGYAWARDLNLAKAILAKLNYNRTRPHKHGDKRFG